MSTDLQPDRDYGEYVEPQVNQGEQLAYTAPPSDAALPPNPVLGAFRERGYDTAAFNDDQQFIQTLESGLSQLSEIPQLKQQLQQQTNFNTAPMPEPDYAPTAPEPLDQTQSWDPPEYDEKWESLVTIDPDTGGYVPINEHVNPSVAHRANEYRSWIKGQGKKFWNNPYDFMKDGLQDWVREIVTDEVGGAVHQNNVDNNVGNFLEQNKQRFYVLDQSGAPIVNQETGTEVLTPEGESLRHHAESARDLGIYDADKIQAYALNMLERDLYAQQANQQYYAQSQPQEQRPQTFLQQAANPGQDSWSPNRDATARTAAEAGVAQNDNASFFEMAMPELMNMGLVQQTG
tara:strand:- start:516 stop:1553 length:1038 start_codon:yes stop_codon:yes gene_type:complete